jgi:hypothetical protein
LDLNYVIVVFAFYPEGTMIRSLITSLLSSIALTASFGPASVYAQPTNQNARCLEGVYALEEFRKDGVVYGSPQVAGRYMVLNGAIFWIFHDRTQQSNQTSYAAFGHYTISGGAFAYRYDDIAVYTHTDAGISVSRELPWEGMRPYVPVLESDGLHLRNVDTRTGFFCSPDGLTYTFGQGDYRKYRRIKSE